MKVDGVGHVWPKTDENVKLGRRTECVLDERDAQRYGGELIKGEKIKGATGHGQTPPDDTPPDDTPPDDTPHNKQVTRTATK